MLEGTSGDIPVQPALLKVSQQDQVDQDSVHLSFKYHQEQMLYNLSGWPAPVLDHQQCK